MAIEKDYLTTYGWTARNAYFKIEEFKYIENSDDIYEMIFFIYLNEKNRNENPDKPLQRNKIKINIDRNIFDLNLTELDNLKTQGYNYLKNKTRGFQKFSKDV